MSTDSIALPSAPAASRPFVDRLHEWVTTVDHKRLGILYIVYALIFLVIGGIEATIMRIQLIVPHNDFVSPQVFNRMFTMHGTTMIFFVAMPIVFGFANYLVPLMIGARDMAFPRLNAFSFWMTAFGGCLLYFSLLGANGLYGAGNAPDVGWFAYAPLDLADILARAQHRLLDAGAAGVRLRQHRNGDQILTTISVHALPGDDARENAAVRLAESGRWRAWCCLPSSPLTAAQIMLLSTATWAAHFFDTQAGGSAVIWMHFFWIFGHPEVYVLVIPAFAFVSEIIPVFSRKAIFGYPVMVAATLAIGFIGHERLGAPHVHGRHEPGRQHVLRAVDDGDRRSDRDQDLQLAGDDVGRKDSASRRRCCSASLFCSSS